MYQITTLSPCFIFWPRNSVSRVTVRRMCGTGVTQRIISGTMLAASFGLARSLAYCSGNWLSTSSPPVIELRVVSLPPTISSTIMPRNSCAGMFAVAGECASIEIRSGPGACFLRSLNRAPK